VWLPPPLVFSQFLKAVGSLGLSRFAGWYFEPPKLIGPSV
jgi:hypothetical protein